MYSRKVHSRISVSLPCLQSWDPIMTRTGFFGFHIIMIWHRSWCFLPSMIHIKWYSCYWSFVYKYISWTCCPHKACITSCECKSVKCKWSLNNGISYKGIVEYSCCIWVWVLCLSWNYTLWKTVWDTHVKPIYFRIDKHPSQSSSCKTLTLFMLLVKIANLGVEFLQAQLNTS